MKILNAFLCMLVLWGCTQDSGIENVYTVPEEFRMDLSQTISETGAVPVFHFTTLNKIGCNNMELQLEYYRHTNNTFIKILGIENASQCISDFDYVQADIADNYDEGIYNFMVEVKEEVENLGTFSVSQERYTLNMHNSPNIILGNTSVVKLPTNSWWGAFYVDKNEYIIKSDSFSDFLSMYSNPLELEKGNYGLFHVDNLGKVLLREIKNNPGYYGFCVSKNYNESDFLYNLKKFVQSHSGLHVFVASDRHELLNI